MPLPRKFGRPIAYHRIFASFAGVTAAVFLSQALYWTDRTGEDGWFYKTREEWQDETGLTRREQEAARKTLKRLGALHEELRGLPAKLYFRVDITVLTSWYDSDQQVGTAEIATNQGQNTRTTLSVHENQPQNEAKNAVPPLYTEITTEITTNNNTVPIGTSQSFLNTQNNEQSVPKALALTEEFITKFNTAFKSDHRVTKARTDKLKLRLKTYKFEEILKAMVNLSRSNWHRGDNERGWRADPDFLLRSDEQIDKWLQGGPKKMSMSESAGYHDAREWMKSPEGKAWGY